MKRLMISLLIVAMMMASCTTVHAADVVANESPAEFESRMAARVRAPSWTTHDGSMRDPVALGQYGTWGIYHENRLLEERTDYEVTMNINYSVRGEKAKQLYEYYLREEAEYSTYSYITPETTYTPKRGNELMIINLTFGVESEENTPLPLKPTDFIWPQQTESESLAERIMPGTSLSTTISSISSYIQEGKLQVISCSKFLVARMSFLNLSEYGLL